MSNWHISLRHVLECLIRISRRENCQPSHRSLWPYCQVLRGGSIPSGFLHSRRPITWSLPGRDWKRPGRPNNRWDDQVHKDIGNMPSTLWRSAILHRHGTRVTQRPSPATPRWWWWWWRWWWWYADACVCILAYYIENFWIDSAWPSLHG